MWIYLPDRFFSVRAYDPDKGKEHVDTLHVCVRTRNKTDRDWLVEQVESEILYETHGYDYPYHVIIPATTWARVLTLQTLTLRPEHTMKDPTNSRYTVHHVVYEATHGLEVLS